MTGPTMTDEEFERYFDEGGDTTEFMVAGSVRQPNKVGQRKVNLTMPDWMVDYLDQRARDTAVSRQAVINTWIAERIQQERERELVPA